MKKQMSSGTRRLLTFGTKSVVFGTKSGLAAADVPVTAVAVTTVTVLAGAAMAVVAVAVIAVVTAGLMVVTVSVSVSDKSIALMTGICEDLVSVKMKKSKRVMTRYRILLVLPSRGELMPPSLVATLTACIICTLWA
jgi:hypothetical protein